MTNSAQAKIESAENPLEYSKKAKNAVVGGFLGYLLDMFDIYLPVIVLAPAMIYFIPENLSSTVSTTIYYTIFSVTLIGRPIGSFIFGHLSDKIGRKRTTEISVAGFGVCTFLMAILPGYHEWGMASIIIMIFLRLVDGIFLGGEYTAAIPLAMEYSPKEKRGFYSGFITSGFPIAYILVSLITAGMYVIAPMGDINSAYVQWGWRIPFLIGAVLSFLFIWYYRNNVSESEVWEKSDKSGSPLKALFTGENLRNFVQVLILMSGIWFMFNSVVSVLPGVLTNILKVPTQTVTIGLIIVYVILGVIYPPIGSVSQKLGRRPIFVIFGVLSVVVAPVVYYFLLSHPITNLFTGFMLVLLLAMITAPVWAVVMAYINERFKTSVRGSGYGIAYSLSVLIPSFFSFYMLWLGNLMPYKYTQIVLLVLGGIMIIIGALMGPETKDVDFSD